MAQAAEAGERAKAIQQTHRRRVILAHFELFPETRAGTVEILKKPSRRIVTASY